MTEQKQLMDLPKQKIKLLCVDLDGTLLEMRNHVSPFSVDALNRFAIINDAEIIIFTGRPLFSVRPILRLLNEQLVRPIRYAVCFNGAMIFDFATETVLDESFIDQENSQKIFQICSQRKLIFWGYPHFLPDRKTYIIVNKISYTRLMVCFKRKMVRYAKNCQNFEFQKIYIFGWKNSLTDLDFLRNEMATHVEVCPSAKNALEITKKGTTKARGITFFKKKLNLEVNEIASIGNSMNDLSMFLVSGYNIAMAKSPAALIENAQLVASKRRKTAFADAIDKIIAYC